MQLSGPLAAGDLYTIEPDYLNPPELLVTDSPASFWRKEPQVPLMPASGSRLVPPSRHSHTLKSLQQ